MLSEAEREAGGGPDTSPDPPGEGYATRSMRGSAHSPLALWVSQHRALRTGKTVNSRKADSIPQIPGAYDQEHRALCSWQSIPNAQNRPVISLSCGAA